MNQTVCNNYSKVRALLFLAPICLLLIIAIAFYIVSSLSVNSYIEIQHKSFLFINHLVCKYPMVLANLTQLGDALVFLSLLSILFIYVPKLWESLITASLISLIFTAVMKNIFAIPRPAAFFDNDTFHIIGERLTASNSLPSGHSITVFTVLTVLMFAFMPAKLKHRIVFYILIILVGLLFAFTRVGVGAHYPLDVIIGSLIGYICGLSGTLIANKLPLWNWIHNKRFYPLFLVLFLICGVLLINRIFERGLLIYYISLVALMITLYKITAIYVQKRDNN